MPFSLGCLAHAQWGKAEVPGRLLHRSSDYVALLKEESLYTSTDWLFAFRQEAEPTQTAFSHVDGYICYYWSLHMCHKPPHLEWDMISQDAFYISENALISSVQVSEIWCLDHRHNPVVDTLIRDPHSHPAISRRLK